MAGQHAAGHLQELRERHAELDFVVAWARHVAGDREELGAAVVRPAEREERVAAVAHDPGHRRERLGVVDGRRLAIEPVARRKGRLEARLALLALERVEERGLFTADVGAVAGVGVKLEAVARAEDVLADIARGARFGQRLLELLVGRPYLAVDVVVAGGRAHGVAGDHHAFDHRVRVVAQEVAILAGARLALVRIAHDVFRARELARHERPLEPGRKAGAATATQAGFLQVVDERRRVDLVAEQLLQRGIALARLVVLEAPVAGVEALHQDCVGTVVQHHLSSAMSLSSFSFVM